MCEIVIPLNVLNQIAGIGWASTDYSPINLSFYINSISSSGIFDDTKSKIRVEVGRWNEYIEIPKLPTNIPLKRFEFFVKDIRLLMKVSKDYKNLTAPVYFKIDAFSWTVISGPASGTILDTTSDVGY